MYSATSTNRTMRSTVSRSWPAAASSALATYVRKNPIKTLLAIAHVRKRTRGPVCLATTHPFVRVLWGQTSYFSRRWDTKVTASEWMLRNHSALAEHRAGAARIKGQIAFAEASDGHRREAWRWAGRALRGDPLQWRAWLACGVAVVPRSSELVLGTLHKWGRGV